MRLKTLLLASLFLLAGSAAFGDTITSRLGLTQPTTSFGDVWGTKVNNNYATIDGAVAGQSTYNVFTASNTFAGPVFFPNISPGSCPTVDSSGTFISAACGGGGSSSMATLVNNVQISSPTNATKYSANFTGFLTGPATANIDLNPNTTYFIHNQASLQTGTTFYVSSGTVAGQMAVTSLKFPDGTVQVSSAPAGTSGTPNGAVGNLQTKGSGGFVGIANFNVWPSSTVITSSGNDSTTMMSLNDTDTVHNPLALLITSTGTSPGLRVTANGANYGTVNGVSGGFVTTCPLAGTQGFCSQFYSNAGAQGQLNGIVNMINDNPNYNSVGLYGYQSADNPQNGIRWDGFDYSCIALIDTKRSASSHNGKFQICSHNNRMYFQTRDPANGSFQNMFWVASSTAIGMVGVGLDFFDPVSTMDVEGSMGIGAGVAGITSAPQNGLLVQGNIQNQALGANLSVCTDGSKNLTTSGCTGGGSSLPLPGGATNYIQNTPTLQSNTTFYVTSGTVSGSFTTNGATRLNNGTEIDIQGSGPVETDVNFTQTAFGSHTTGAQIRKLWYGNSLPNTFNQPIFITNTGGASLELDGLGAAGINGLQVQTTFYVNGNVAIGAGLTASGASPAPTGGLYVQGGALLSSATVSGNLYISSAVIDAQTNRWIYNTNAGSNFFAGDGAGTLTCSGTSDVGVGQNAFGSCTTALQTTCIGNGSCQSLQTGSNGTFLGFGAGGNRTSAFSETGFGYQTLQKNTLTDNTALGNGSAQYATSVSSSVFVGSASGGTGNAGSTATLSGIGLGMIGFGATVSSTYTLTNAMAIGYNAVVNSSNTIQLGSNGTTVNASALNVNGSGNGAVQLTIAGSTYTATASSTPAANVVGHPAVWTSTNNTLGDAGYLANVIVPFGAYGVGLQTNSQVNLSSAVPACEEIVLGNSVSISTISFYQQSNLSSSTVVGFYDSACATLLQQSTATLAGNGIANVLFSPSVALSAGTKYFLCIAAGANAYGIYGSPADREAYIAALSNAGEPATNYHVFKAGNSSTMNASNVPVLPATCGTRTSYANGIGSTFGIVAH